MNEQEWKERKGKTIEELVDDFQANLEPKVEPEPQVEPEPEPKKDITVKWEDVLELPEVDEGVIYTREDLEKIQEDYKFLFWQVHLKQLEVDSLNKSKGGRPAGSKRVGKGRGIARRINPTKTGVTNKPQEITLNYTLSDTACRVYDLIRILEWKHGETTASQAGMAKILWNKKTDHARRKIGKALKELETAGYIEKRVEQISKIKTRYYWRSVIK